MKSVKHITNTWLLTVISFPWIFILYLWMIERTSLPLDWLLVTFLFSLILSSGGYLLCLFFFQPVRLLQIPTGLKFLIWIVVMEACIVLGTYLICGIFFDFSFFGEVKKFLLIPCITAAIVALIRFEQFCVAVDNEPPTE